MCSQVTDATIALAKKEKQIKTLFLRLTDRGILGGIAPGGGGTLGISGWGCAAGTLEPLTFTRAS